MTAVRADRARSTPRSGWTVVAAKEFGDHLLSVRFAVLVIILSIAAAVPLYFLSGLIREAAEGATSYPALFIALFWQTPSVNENFTLPSVVGFLALVGPLLGLTFAFDAVNDNRCRAFRFHRALLPPCLPRCVPSGRSTAPERATSSPVRYSRSPPICLTELISIVVPSHTAVIVP